MKIQDRIQAQIPAWHARIDKLRKKYDSFVVGQVTIDQILSGIRGVQISISDISYVDPDEGIRLRGYTVPELLKQLPRADKSQQPLAGGLYYLLLTGELPTDEDARQVEEEWRRRKQVPEFVYGLLDGMPPDTHPMTLLSQAIMALQTESVFAKAYQDGLTRPEFWTYFSKIA